MVQPRTWCGEIVARIRSIKPETATDRKLATVTRDARYTFVLLISQADDDGLVRAEPRQLLGNLYPYDPDVTTDLLEDWLSELVSIGTIRFRETVDCVRVVQIVHWKKHQVIKNRSKPFILTQLADDQETLPGLYGETTNNGSTPDGGAGGAESRVLSPESRVLSWPAAFAKILAAIGDFEPGRVGKALAGSVARTGIERSRVIVEAFTEMAPYQKADGTFDRNVQAHHFCTPERLRSTWGFWLKYTEPLITAKD